MGAIQKEVAYFAVHFNLKMFEDIFIDFTNIWTFISKWLLIIEDEGLRVIST